jgi:hypothetical protein
VVSVGTYNVRCKLRGVRLATKNQGTAQSDAMARPEYRKHVYWLSEEKFAVIKRDLEASGIEPHRAKKAVCVPLAWDIEVGYVPAGSWDRYGLCKRQLSWHAQSPYAGKVLLVSSRPIDGLEPTCVITERKRFKPPRLPNEGEKQALLERPSYKDSRPQVWEDIAAEGPEQQERWMRVMGIRGKTFAELFIGHCATHANFIAPHFYVEEDGLRVPYSLGKTLEICSACLEYYGIIGDQHRRKLVVPCPGAVLFAGLAVNRYYEVTCSGNTRQS